MEIEDMIDDAEIENILGEEEEEIFEDETEESGLSEDDIQSILKSAVQDAVDFIESEVSEDRIKAQRYYDGEVDLQHEDGRSTVVATKVRDTVRATKPSLMRVFLSSTRPVEYIPTGPEDVQMAEQSSDYAMMKFNECNGYRILSDVFHDALVKKMGIAKVCYEEKADTQIHSFTGLNDMQFEALMMDQDVEVIEHVHVQEENPEMGMTSTHDVKVSRTTYDGDIVIESIPPEEFFFDNGARSIDDLYVVGHRTDKRISDLVAMGFDLDEVSELSGTTDSDSTSGQEEEERAGYTDDQTDENSLDPSMKKVMVTEAYMKIDVEGDGFPVLYKAILGGSTYKLLDLEPCDDVPFATFEVDPEPHTMLGHSLADLVSDDQDTSTSILRGILDNVAMTNNPRLAVLEGAVNYDDMMNNEIGGVVRMTQPGAVMPLDVPFTAGQTMVALQYVDQLVEQKTGVTRASMGLDPDAMQSTAKAAVSATIQAAAGQTEVMVRNLAQGGMRRLFKLMLKLIVKHADGPKMMRLNGSYQPVDPRVWNTEMDVGVNVGLGTGREEEKAMAYREILGMQQQIWQAYGPGNGLVTMTNMRNTMSDMAASAGIYRSERYFSPMDPQIEQQMMQQQAQQGEQQGDPQSQAYLQAEQMKAQVKQQSDAQKAQIDGQKAMAEHQRKMREMAAQDDLARDKMAQDFTLANTELAAKYGIQADAVALKAEQERERMFWQNSGGV